MTLASASVKQYNTNMAPLPDGHTNNPHGRPKIGDEPRVTFSARVAPETVAAISAEAERREISRGLLIDEIVARQLIRKRKPN